MKLSDELIEQLRPTARPATPREPYFPEAIARNDHDVPDEGVTREHQNGNGYAPKEPHRRGRSRSLSESRFTQRPLTDAIPAPLDWTGLEDRRAPRPDFRRPIAR